MKTVSWLTFSYSSCAAYLSVILAYSVELGMTLHNILSFVLFQVLFFPKFLATSHIFRELLFFWIFAALMYFYMYLWMMGVEGESGSMTLFQKLQSYLLFSTACSLYFFSASLSLFLNIFQNGDPVAFPSAKRPN